MKRSEMLKEIVKLAKDWEASKLDKKFADELLSKIEKLRTVPPGYLKPIPFEKDGKQYPLIPGDFLNSKEIWCTPGTNEWEKE